MENLIIFKDFINRHERFKSSPFKIETEMSSLLLLESIKVDVQHRKIPEELLFF